MLIGDGKAQTFEGGKERMEAGEISHLKDFHFLKCVFWPCLYLTATAPWGNSPRQALAGGPGYRATWPLQLEPHPGRMRSPTGFYFNGWIMAWFAVNFASQYDAAIFPAFPAPKWDVWCYFKNGFHWNLVNLNGKTFLWVYSQVLCQEVPKWAFAVTQGMHCTPLGQFIFTGGGCTPLWPWMLMHRTINTLRGEGTGDTPAQVPQCCAKKQL